MTPRITHVTFAVKDFDESIEFYKKWFKLEIHRDRRPFTIWMATAEQNKKSVPDFVFVLGKTLGEINPVDHFGFQVEDRELLDIIANEARTLGILVEGPEDVGGAVGSFVMIKDPNGHIWEYTVGQPLVGL